MDFIWVEYRLQGSGRLRRMALAVIRAAGVKDYCWGLRVKLTLLVSKRAKLRRLVGMVGFLAEATAQVQGVLERRGHILSSIVRVYAV